MQILILLAEGRGVNMFSFQFYVFSPEALRHVLCIVQVWSINRHLWNGLLCRARACWLPCCAPQEVQGPCWDPAQGDQGGLDEVVPGQVRRCHPQQGSGQHGVNLSLSKLHADVRCFSLLQQSYKPQYEIFKCPYHTLCCCLKTC